MDTRKKWVLSSLLLFGLGTIASSSGTPKPPALIASSTFENLAAPEHWFVGQAISPNRWILIHAAESETSDPSGPSFGSVIEPPFGDRRTQDLVQKLHGGKIKPGDVLDPKLPPVKTFTSIRENCWAIEFEAPTPGRREIQTWCEKGSRTLAWIEAGSHPVPDDIRAEVIDTIQARLDESVPSGTPSSTGDSR